VALPQPDPRILKAAAQGDERAFRWIVEAYQPRLLSYVYRLMGDRGAAEDLTQEILLRVHQRLPGFSGNCLFTTWLFQIAKNRVIDEIRAKERRPVEPAELEQLAAARTVDPPSERSEMMEALWGAVAKLELGQKMALLLRDVVGLSYLEIAEALETDLGTVKWRIYKARETVQQTLVAYGYSTPVPVSTRAAAAAAGTTPRAAAAAP
jgi:RNA polymerase sigma-70 factor (ECF subfamily)